MGPVFVVGQARSGSSILFRLVHEHPAFRPPGEQLNLAESHVVDAILGSATLANGSVRAFAELDDAGWVAFQRDLAASAARRRLLRALPAGALRRSPAAWRSLGGDAALRAFVEHARRGRGVGRLVEKTPWHLPWVRHLLAVDGARAVSISRHPVRVFASYRRRAAEDPGARWAAITVDDFVARWGAEAAHTARLLDEPRFRLVGYEELVADPAAVAQDLFAWLGEAPPPEALGAVAVNPHAPVSDAEQLASPIGAVGSSWDRWVTDAEATAIEGALAPLIERLGRPPLGAS